MGTDSADTSKFAGMTMVHAAQRVNPSYAGRDVLPEYTPMVGDLVRYLHRGIEVTAGVAAAMLKAGEVVEYETYEK